MKIDTERPIIVVTGPESSGKTTLARYLSSKYDLALVPEFAREYLESNGQKYTFDDLKDILSIQCAREEQAFIKFGIFICDTDYITIDIWAKEVFGKGMLGDIPYISQKHYLLCRPDLTWEEDPLRENPNDRERLFDVYHSYLIEKNLPFTIIQGEGKDRYDFEK